MNTYTAKIDSGVLRMTINGPIDDVKRLISNAIVLEKLGHSQIAKAQLRIANEGLVKYFVAKLDGVERAPTKSITGFIYHKKMKANYPKKLLHSLKEINDETKSYAHYQQSSVDEVQLDDILEKIVSIIIEYIDPKYELIELKQEILSKDAQTKGREAFDEIVKLQFSMGNTGEFLARRNNLIDSLFSKPENRDSEVESIHKEVQNLLAGFDFSLLDDRVIPGNEILSLMLNSGDEDMIRRVGKIAKENSFTELQFVAYYQMGRMFLRQQNNSSGLKWMKKCLNFSSKLDSTQYKRLYNDFFLAAVYRINQIYVDQSEWKRSEKFLHDHRRDLKTYGSEQNIRDYLYRFATTKFSLNLHRDALILSQECLAIDEKLDDIEGKIRTFILQSSIAHKMGNHKLAKSLLKDAKELAITNNLSNLITEIGTVEGFWQNYQRR